MLVIIFEFGGLNFASLILVLISLIDLGFFYSSDLESFRKSHISKAWFQVVLLGSDGNFEVRDLYMGHQTIWGMLLTQALLPLLCFPAVRWIISLCPVFPPWGVILTQAQSNKANQRPNKPFLCRSWSLPAISYGDGKGTKITYLLCPLLTSSRSLWVSLVIIPANLLLPMWADSPLLHHRVWLKEAQVFGR